MDIKFVAARPITERVWTNTSKTEIVRMIRSNFPKLTGVLAALLDRLEGKEGPQADENPHEAEGRCPHCGTELTVERVRQQRLFK